MNNYGIEKINAISFKKGTPLFEKIRWLTEAVYTDDTRYFMKGVHVEKDGNKTILVSTDGKRLHKLEIEDIDIDAGEYQIDTNNNQAVILSTAKEEYTFPNWKKIMPKNKKHFKITFAQKGKNSDQAFSINVAEILKTTGACINQTFLNPLRGNDWNVSFESASNSFVFTSGIMQSVIMPVKEVSALEVTEDEEFEKIATTEQEREILSEVKAMTNEDELRKELEKATKLAA